MPATAREPSGTLVLVLCGQPLQNPRRAVFALDRRDFETAFLGLDQRDARVHARGRIAIDAELLQALGDRLGDDRGCQVGLRAQQPVLARGRAAPFAAAVISLPVALVELAEHVRPHIGAPVVELFLDLVLDDLPLLLDDEDLLKALREGARDRRLERPDDVDLVQPDAELPAGGFVEAEVAQRLARVVVGLAGSDQAESVVRAGDHVVVSRRGSACSRGCRRGAHTTCSPSAALPVRARRRASGCAGRLRASRNRSASRCRSGPDRRNTLDADSTISWIVFMPDQTPAKRLSANACRPHVEDVLHARREEHRQAAGLEDVVALVCGGRALGDVVVACDRDHAAVLRRAGHVGLLEDIRGSGPRPGPCRTRCRTRRRTCCSADRDRVAASPRRRSRRALH